MRLHHNQRGELQKMMLTVILRRLNDELRWALAHSLRFYCYGGRNSSSDKFALRSSIRLNDLNSDPTLQCSTNNERVIANAECKLSDRSGEQENEHKCSTSKPTYNYFRQTTLWEFVDAKDANDASNHNEIRPSTRIHSSRDGGKC
jgi:hypothetical protein